MNDRFTSKADIEAMQPDVRFGPKADIAVKTGPLARCAYGTLP